jgi:outer membrane protein assembly factor BamB
VRPDVIVGNARDTPTGSEYVAAFDPVSHASRWRSPPLNCDGRGVLLVDDVALLSCYGGDLAFDLASGKQLWSWPITDPYRGSAASGPTFYRAQFDPDRGPLADGGYRRTGITTIEAVDARSWTRRWSAELEVEARKINASAGQLYAMDDSEVYAYDASGAERWTWTSPRPWLLDRIAGSGEQVVVAGHSYRPEDPDDALIAAVDASSGSTRWQITLPEPSSNNQQARVLVVAGDTVVAAAGSTVYAIADSDSGGGGT